MLFAELTIDWGALLQVAYISAIAGILIATVLGAGIVAQLRAQDSNGGNVIVLHAATVIAVLLVAAAVAMGIYFITDK
jgi:hypothetical protein